MLKTQFTVIACKRLDIFSCKMIFKITFLDYFFLNKKNISTFSVNLYQPVRGANIITSKLVGWELQTLVR